MDIMLPYHTNEFSHFHFSVASLNTIRLEAITRTDFVQNFGQPIYSRGGRIFLCHNYAIHIHLLYSVQI